MLFLQQAISAVSGLHRYKIGGKRIQVSLITGGNNKTLSMLRWSVEMTLSTSLNITNYIDVYFSISDLKLHFDPFTAQRSSVFFRMHLPTASLYLSSLRSMRKSQCCSFTAFSTL